MYRFRSLFNSKHGYPVKKYQCRNEKFRRFFSIVSKTEGPEKSQKESFDLWFDYLHFNGSRSLFVKIPRTCQSNFIRARSVQHAPTPKSVVNNEKRGQNRNKKVRSGHCQDASYLSEVKGHYPAGNRKKFSNFIFPKNPSFDGRLRSGVDKIQEVFRASCVLDSGTSPVTRSDLEPTGGTRAEGALYRNIETDKELYQDLIHRQNSPGFVKMADFRKKLPSVEIKDNFLKLLDNNQVVIVSGSTGCGKSTQLPQYVLDDFILSKEGSLCNIICIVPRRICATSLAARVSEERQEPLGRSVGYQIRHHKMLSSRKTGCINFVTTGIFMDMLTRGRGLGRFSHIFVDEVHERNIESDMILAALKQRLDKIPCTRIILMSGTMNSALFSEYMGGAPFIEAPGFLFPVKEYYLEDVLGSMNFTFGDKKCEPVDEDFEARVLPYVRSISKRYPSRVITELSKPTSEIINYGLIACVVEHIVKSAREGCILIFLPGINDIIAMDKTLSSLPWYSSYRLKTLWMHSSLSKEHQERIYSPTPEGSWKIIISTTILETSVTVPEVKYVIDAGKMQGQEYNLDLDLRELKELWISRSNALQRRGRAGRVQEGVCVKLYTRGRERCFTDYPIPEVQRASLEAPFIRGKFQDSKGDARAFFKTLIDPPPIPLVDASVKNLQEIDVLDLEENLTLLGECVARMPCPPQLAKLLLLGAIFRCFDPISSIASVIGEKGIFSNRPGETRNMLNVKRLYDENDFSDHLITSRMMKEWDLTEDRRAFVADNMVSRRALEAARMCKKAWASMLWDMGFLPGKHPWAPDNNTYSENKNLVKALLCGGFYPNIAYETHFLKGSRLKPRRGTIVMFSTGSICSTMSKSGSPFFAYFDQILRKANFISDATMVNPLPVILFCKRLAILKCPRDSHCVVMIDDITRFQIPWKTLRALREFRKCLREILDHCYRNPDELDKLHREVMPRMVDLLSCQDLDFLR